MRGAPPLLGAVLEAGHAGEGGVVDHLQTGEVERQRGVGGQQGPGEPAPTPAHVTHRVYRCR